MIVLNADNRSVTKGMPQTSIEANILSGTAAVVMKDVTGLAADQKILIGIWGSDSSEVARIQSINTATRTVTMTAGLSKAHAESSPVSVMKYDQVRFYWTDTATFSASIPVTAYTNLDPTSYFTSTTDLVHQTGFGWFVFYHSIGGYASSNSNAIPYANFGYSSVKKIADAFYSRLNQTQQRLITWDDALMYMNEAYSKTRAHLGLINFDYTTSAEYTVSVVSGTQEYALPSRFSDLVYIRNSETGNQILPVRMWEIPEQEKYGGGSMRYYIRGNYLGFSPTPTSNATITIRYSVLPTFLTSYYDTIDLPDDNFWLLVDFMEWRASPKLNRDGTAAKTAYEDAIGLMKQIEATRGTGQDSIRATRSAWV